LPQGRIFHEEEGIELFFLVEEAGLCCPKEKGTKFLRGEKDYVSPWSKFPKV
jgi:hypothetical protein